jgi:hypothetical protein
MHRLAATTNHQLFLIPLIVIIIVIILWHAQQASNQSQSLEPRDDRNMQLHSTRASFSQLHCTVGMFYCIEPFFLLKPSGCTPTSQCLGGLPALHNHSSHIPTKPSFRPRFLSIYLLLPLPASLLIHACPSPHHPHLWHRSDLAGGKVYVEYCKSDGSRERELWVDFLAPWRSAPHLGVDARLPDSSIIVGSEARLRHGWHLAGAARLSNSVIVGDRERLLSKRAPPLISKS